MFDILQKNENTIQITFTISCIVYNIMNSTYINIEGQNEKTNDDENDSNSMAMFLIFTFCWLLIPFFCCLCHDKCFGVYRENVIYHEQQLREREIELIPVQLTNNVVTGIKTGRI